MNCYLVLVSFLVTLHFFSSWFKRVQGWMTFLFIPPHYCHNEASPCLNSLSATCALLRTVWGSSVKQMYMLKKSGPSSRSLVGLS